jgi:ribonucleoside-diphosphate reductase alpha chain
LKGITVYREGSREGILITDKPKEEAAPDETQKIETVAAVESEATQTQTAVTKAPRSRPVLTSGATRRIRTGEGSLYITINEDENGLCEIFTTIGKAGGNAAAQSEAISRLISLALRSGIDPYAIVKQLKGISGPNPTWEDGKLILSTPDAIGKALDDYLKHRESNDPNEQHLQFTMASSRESNNKDVADFTLKNLSTCPDCGSTLQHQSGCVTCRSCGFSKCD